MQIEVTGGDFIANPKSRFAHSKIILFDTPHAPALRYRASDLAAFSVDDGYWYSYLTEAGDWARAAAAAAAAGLPGAAANGFLPRIVFGQTSLITWANAMIGGVAAKAALDSRRKVQFRARFNDGRRVIAKSAERQLSVQLPRLVNALVAAKV